MPEFATLDRFRAQLPFRLYLSVLEVDVYAPPFALIKSNDAERAPGDMTGENGDPHVDRVERPRSLNYKTNSKRNRDLGNDRDEKGTLRVARALQSARVGQCDGDKNSGEGKNTKELGADFDNRRIDETKYRKKLCGKEEEEESDERR